MTRVNKKSRAKYLPPRIQLQIRDSITGSYPTKIRGASDNRNGKYNIFFDDSKTIMFNNSSKIEYPSGLLSGSSALFNDDGTVNSELVTNIFTTGGAFKDVGEQFVHFSPGQDLQPFRDSDNPAVDGISTNNTFYSTGSSVINIGEGFTEQLWNKTKIEFDLTPSVDHSFFIENGTGNSRNFPMAYWNNVTRKFEGIGNGVEFQTYTGSSDTSNLTKLKRYLDEQCMGFGASIGVSASTVDQTAYVIGAPITNFGFPVHQKFYASSSNLIDMSNYISEPFLLEKIVLCFSGTHCLNNTYDTTNFSGFNIETFFILNQRKPFTLNTSLGSQIIRYYSGSDTQKTFVTGTVLPTTYNNVYVDSIRDLVTYAQISFVNTSYSEELKALSRRDYDTSELDFNDTITWSKQVIMSASVKSPNTLNIGSLCGFDYFVSGSGLIQLGSAQYLEQYNFSGRNGISIPNGRNFLNTYSSAQKIGTGMFFGLYNTSSFSFDVVGPKESINPYLLFPADKLVFGWQLPYVGFSQNRYNGKFGAAPIYNGKGPELSFSTKGINKIIFYGSYVKEGIEKHDTLNQLLTSPSIHEVIE